MALLPIDALLDFVSVLEASGVRYIVGGSFASSTHGIYRATNDIDIACELNVSNIDAFIELLTVGSKFYVDPISLKREILDKRSWSVMHEGSWTKIDIFCAHTAFHLEQLQRAVTTQINSQSICIASPEDTILAKLQWFKLTGESSQRQLGDVKGVVKINGDGLDREYIEEWASRLEVTHLLDNVFES